MNSTSNPKKGGGPGGRKLEPVTLKSIAVNNKSIKKEEKKKVGGGKMLCMLNS